MVEFFLEYISTEIFIFDGGGIFAMNQLMHIRLGLLHIF